MTFASLLPLAQAASGKVRTTFEWGRIQENSDWILPVAACVAAMVFVRAMYRRDAVELPALLGWFLTILRTATFFGLLILYLQPQWRTEQEVKRNSRALVLVDTSLSMALTDFDASPGSRPASRIEQVAAVLDTSNLTEKLRATHDTAVCRFHENLDPTRLSFDKLAADGETGDDGSDEADAGADQGASKATEVDWGEFLKPVGAETRLGQALRQLIHEESGMPLSGIVLITDGGQNAGISPDVATELAKRDKIPVIPIGIGSDRKPPNVRVSDLVAPARAYPGDSYTVTGYIQAQEMAGKTVRVELLQRENGPGGEPTADGGSVIERQEVVVGADGEAIPVEFQLAPETTGSRTFRFRVIPPLGDRNAADDMREADVEIVDRKNRVLLLAGGPTREYRFLRTQLFRDESTTVDVLLQTIPAGVEVAQEADKMLDDFPATRPEMFEYDCVVAFDPDWQALSAGQIDLLETWVAEQGGGLIAIAGPVYAGKTVGGWVDDSTMDKIRALYPVEFRRRYSVLDEGTYATEEAWPLDFTREGLEAEYLWLADTAAAGREAWSGFAGVYGYCPVRGSKPGATVLARFSDPETGLADRRPVFFASQFYGSGRVFYIGSGEMWRLRKVDTTYFETFYTKLIRHVTQGRLLRGSRRGVLLVGKERYQLGNRVEVRAQLTDAQLAPLEAPEVTLQVVAPDSSVQPVVLQADPTRPGTFLGRFPVLSEGSYRLELPVSESDEVLTRRIQVNVPDLERENPQRNDKLLSRIAEETDGRYFAGLEKAIAAGDASAVVSLLPDRTKTEITPAESNRSQEWEKKWQMWMMIALCSLLCLEWLIRRLAKLA